MSKVVLTLPNTAEYQMICRDIRDLHKKRNQPLTIRFSEGLTHIQLEAPLLYIPDKRALGREAKIEGTVKKMAGHYEIHPREKGKTIHLFLDSELVTELEQIRSHVKKKTQHDVILDMFIRGLRAYQAEQEEEEAATADMGKGLLPSSKED
ncbi:MAG TPA: hypothetical protein VE710_09370 [Candidatus Bathyarchaeia archaeon]|nr:hypothetical protein [Candidatus Bathyarchaeia archaeon]